MKTDRQFGGMGAGLGLGTDAEPGQEQGKKPLEPPPDEAKARFERLLAGEPEEPRRQPPGPATFAGPGGFAGPAGPTAPPQPSAGLGGLVEEVADRVLVSDRRFDASQEVRIKVKDSVFPGLEVRLRQVDGRLQVELVAAQAGDLLVLRREARRLLGDLRQRLARPVDLSLAVEPADGGPPSREPVEEAQGPPPGPAGLPRGPAG